MTSRDSYGALPHNTDEAKKALLILREAIVAGKVDGHYITTTHKRKQYYESLNYSLFDIKGSTALFQARYFVKEKYTSLTISYFLISRRGKGVVVTEVATTPADKAKLRKIAKGEPKLGTIIDWLQGKVQPRLPKPKQTIYRAFRVMEQDGDILRSVYDESEWTLGKARTHKARPGHNGGFYWYNSEENVRTVALQRNKLLREALAEGRNLVVVECEAWGNLVTYEDLSDTPPYAYPIKHCTTYVRPLRIVGQLVETTV